MLLPFIGILSAMLLAMLDGMVVGTAMPRIVTELGGVDHLSWVVTAYLLTSTVATPVYGKLGDMYGHKRVFLSAVALFLAGSALCGAAADMGQLIAFRAVQGLGAGGLIVGGISLIGLLVPPRQRGKYQGLSGGLMALTMIAGPLVGGVITDSLSWRWAFYVNLPIGVVTLVVLAVAVRLPYERRPHRVDYLGTALVAAVASALVLAASWGGQRYAWGSPQILGLFAVAAIGTALLVPVERRAAEPVLPPAMFANRELMLSAALAAVTGFGMFGAVNFLPMYQQVVQGASATSSGLLLLPMMLGMLATSIVSGKMITRTGRYKAYPLAGTLLTGAGLAAFSLLDADTGQVYSTAAMLVFGVGLGFVWQLPTLIGQNSVEAREIGAATGLVRFAQAMGGSFGVAISGAILAAGLDGAAPGSRAYVPAFADALSDVFLWSLPAAALGLVTAVLIKEVPLRDESPRPAPEDERVPA
ncbi:MDR family MFS transporter [Bailinhaonella thermotolerans]|uniref:MFS transporter n=1 Tax=Bailinhaonella thermotolerans TaxID=1070861 RepID=A0A3A4BNB5_9ACTN|nr:MDR family MFS transporter [Bailinhaonella thermotolerans]RJL32554.1 MFS transporter [Bailinhaonella thermotolerans]